MKLQIVIIVLVAVLVFAYERTGLLGDCVGIGGFACYAFMPFYDQKRVRARWATFTILFNGLLGMAYATVYLMLHQGWLVVSSHTNHVIHTYLLVVGGIFLGVTLTLIFSGQLLGLKRDSQETRNDPAP
jgi:drug/metabolite transporter (DMT)-like permease